jgi:hypothetical protein
MKLAATLGLNVGGFLGPLQQVRSALGGLKGQIVGAVGAYVSIQAALTGIRTVSAGIKEALDLGGTLSDLQAQTSASAGELRILQQAFDAAGVGAEAVGPAINKMQKVIAQIGEEGQGADKLLQSLGLDRASLAQMAAPEQLNAIGMAISALQDPAQRTEASMRIFGLSGGKMLAMLSDPSAIETAKGALKGLPGLLDRNAASFDKVSDSLGNVKLMREQLFVALNRSASSASRFFCLPAGRVFEVGTLVEI